MKAANSGFHHNVNLAFILVGCYVALSW